MTAAVLASRARRDLLQAVRWIQRDNPAAAARALRDAVAVGAGRLGDHPVIGVSRPKVARATYRFLPLTGFPYVLVHNAERRPPLIARVLHGARALPGALGDLRRERPRADAATLWGEVVRAQRVSVTLLRWRGRSGERPRRRARSSARR
jgi:toxin ParE1/3/4